MIAYLLCNRSSKLFSLDDVTCFHAYIVEFVSFVCVCVCVCVCVGGG